MSIELLKSFKNKPILCLYIIWIVGLGFLTPRFGSTIPPDKNFTFLNQINPANAFLFTFSSFYAYLTCLFGTAIIYIMYINDFNLYSTRRINFLRTTLPAFTIGKTLAFSFGACILYLLSASMYALLIQNNFGINILESPVLFLFLFFKFALNVVLFSAFLFFSLTLLNSRRHSIFLIICVLFYFSIIKYPNSYYTPFNWLVNALGFISRLTNNSSYNPMRDLKSEFLMAGLDLALMIVYYMKYEIRKRLY